MKLIITFFFTMLFSFAFSQVKYEYLGVIKLNGDSKNIISYRLVFEEVNGKVKGYSVTDMGGEHETKNIIRGTYNAKSKEFSYREEDILYTKSAINNDMFCFINFSGKIKLVNENSKLEGNFNGLFNNKTKCINGSITLIGSNKLFKALSKLDKKIQKTKRVDAATKQKTKPLALLDSLKVNNLTKSQNLNVFWKSETVELEFWDSGREDGDIINLYQNDKLILKNYKVTNARKRISFKPDKKNLFRITAINEGTVSPNTVMIMLTDGDRTFELMSNLKKDEEASITILKN